MTSTFQFFFRKLTGRQEEVPVEESMMPITPPSCSNYPYANTTDVAALAPSAPIPIQSQQQQQQQLRSQHHNHHTHYPSLYDTSTRLSGMVDPFLCLAGDLSPFSMNTAMASDISSSLNTCGSSFTVGSLEDPFYQQQQQQQMQMQMQVQGHTNYATPVDDCSFLDGLLFDDPMLDCPITDGVPCSDMLDYFSQGHTLSQGNGNPAQSVMGDRSTDAFSSQQSLDSCLNAPVTPLSMAPTPETVASSTGTNSNGYIPTTHSTSVAAQRSTLGRTGDFDMLCSTMGSSPVLFEQQGYTPPQEQQPLVGFHRRSNSAHSQRYIHPSAAYDERLPVNAVPLETDDNILCSDTGSNSWPCCNATQPLVLVESARSIGGGGGAMTDHAPTKSAKKASRASRPRTYHQCPFCSHSSYRAHNMREHILTHDPNRPKDFKCVRCEKAFARKHDLKRHVKTHERRRQHDGLPRVIFI